MNIKPIIPLGACAALVASHAAPFGNLTFDEAVTNNLIPQSDTRFDKGTVSDLLPGWGVQYNQTPIGQIYFSGAPDVAGVERRGITLYANSAFPRQFVGAYSVAFLDHREATDGVPRLYTVTLSQKGQVPPEALGLWVNTTAYNTEFRLDGQLVDWNHDPNGYVDLRGFAGQEVLLSITFPVGDGGKFDILGFAVVPEPSTWALLGVGASALLFVSRRKH